MADGSVAERAQIQALIEADRKAEERDANSPRGMQAIAKELRRKAVGMRDSSDRDAMIRLAAGYEKRADDALRFKRLR